MSITPTQASQITSTAFAAVPGGKIGFVSESRSAVNAAVGQSPLSFLASAASNVASVAKDIFGPSEFNVPGAAPIASGISKAAQRVGNATAESISNVAHSAATGIESGARYATLILILVVGLWIWKAVKP